MAKILMVTSEAAPFAKTGGLADVLGALPQALVQQGHEVMVVMPAYGNANLKGAERFYNELPVWMTGGYFNCALDRIERNGVRYVFVNCPPLFGRHGLYGDMWGDFGDNPVRFAVLSRAAIEIAQRVFLPDILHVHDWQGSLAPVYLKTEYRGNPSLQRVRTVLTIHNLGYQGQFNARVLNDLGINIPSVFHINGLEYFGDVNLLKGGIEYSDFITTVSPKYALEIQTPEHGFGLDPLLRAKSSILAGILNGVDYGEWSPENDPYLPANYSAKDLSGKRVCKKALLDEYGLDSSDLDRPLAGIVSRFAHQKGLDLVAECIQGIADLGIQLVVLGNGDAALERAFGGIAAAKPEQFGYRGEYNNRLSHLVEAGSDMFLMPSRYEPCGLNQIYSLRYGTVPIVRATGGLDDTIQHETGFKFWGATSHELYGCIAHALHIYENEPEWWKTMMINGMSKDFSWDASATEYSNLYQRLMATA
ncbi:glycogen synthase 1 [Bryobacterales bacterium F-183]|nr:glycogen synthase 1 [Bryobacterales bacterium F-183]